MLMLNPNIYFLHFSLRVYVVPILIFIQQSNLMVLKSQVCNQIRFRMFQLEDTKLKLLCSINKYGQYNFDLH